MDVWVGNLLSYQILAPRLRTISEVTQIATIKSSRHSRIIGSLGELVICNWLSVSGFEIEVVDHTGIDLVAYHVRTGRRLGITVKSRTRMSGKEGASVTIAKVADGDLTKIHNACEVFGCEPWIGVYVEIEQRADLYLTSLEHFRDKYVSSESLRTLQWKMTPRWLEAYDQDTNVFHLRADFRLLNWWA